MHHNSLLTTVGMNPISRSLIDNFKSVTSSSELFRLLLIRSSLDLHEEFISQVGEGYILYLYYIFLYYLHSRCVCVCVFFYISHFL